MTTIEYQQPLKDSAGVREEGTTDSDFGYLLLLIALAVLVYRGHMRLGEYHYRLDNLSITETNGDRRVNANVVGPLREIAGTNKIVGSISITVMRHEGIWIGDGELTMTEGGYEGEYRVLLDMLPPRQRR